MEAENNIGPKIGPCGPPALIFSMMRTGHFKHNTLSFMPFCFNLYISPSCHTLSMLSVICLEILILFLSQYQKNNINIMSNLPKLFISTCYHI